MAFTPRVKRSRKSRGLRQAEEILDHLFAGRCQHALGMELHSLNRKLSMAEAHNDASAILIACPGTDFEVARQVAFPDDQGVITSGSKRRVNSPKDGSPVVFHRAGLAVHQSFGADHLPTESLADRLMSEADTEDRNFAGKVADQFDADPGVLRRARARGNDDALGIETRYLVHAEFVVPPYFDASAQFAEVLDEVVGERVVIVENKDHKIILNAVGRYLSIVVCRSSSKLNRPRIFLA